VIAGPESSAAQAVARELSLEAGACGFCGPGARARAKDSRLSGFDGFGSSSASAGDVPASANIAARRRSCAM
jgi:hypothetical protein